MTRSRIVSAMTLCSVWLLVAGCGKSDPAVGTWSLDKDAVLAQKAGRDWDKDKEKADKMRAMMPEVKLNLASDHAVKMTVKMSEAMKKMMQGMAEGLSKAFGGKGAKVKTNQTKDAEVVLGKWQKQGEKYLVTFKKGQDTKLLKTKSLVITMKDGKLHAAPADQPDDVMIFCR